MLSFVLGIVFSKAGYTGINPSMLVSQRLPVGWRTGGLPPWLILLQLLMLSMPPWELRECALYKRGGAGEVSPWIRTGWVGDVPGIT